MKVFLTGGSGFVGSALAKALVREGHQVSLLMRKSSSAQNLAGLSYIRIDGDLHDIELLRKAVAGMDIIYHIAGQVAANRAADFFASNAQGTETLALAALGAKHLRKFVYLSSLAAAGPSRDGRSQSEGNQAQPISLYGQSKLAGEEALKKLSLPSRILRPPIVYGPYDRGMLSFFKIINHGIHPTLGCGRKDRRYSFIHIDDLVEALLRVGFSEKNYAPAELFYAAGEGEYSWDEAMEFIAMGLRKKTLKVPVPISAIKVAGLVNSLLGRALNKNLPLNFDKTKEIAARYWICSNEKIKREFAFKPRWDLAQGLAATAQWYATHAWL